MLLSHVTVADPDGSDSSRQPEHYALRVNLIQYPQFFCTARLKKFSLKKSIDLSRLWTREPWISRRARYPETSEADLLSEVTPGKNNPIYQTSLTVTDEVSQNKVPQWGHSCWWCLRADEIPPREDILKWRSLILSAPQFLSTTDESHNADWKLRFFCYFKSPHALQHSEDMFSNIMFHAPMGRFHLGSKLELPLFSSFTVVPFN